MKLKMAENSLFAILLRSPWWASLGLAIGLALLMRLLLPEQYAVAGMLGSFPFVVIAAMAAWKQLRTPSVAQLEQTMQRLQALSSQDFAQALEAAFRAQGHDVRRINGPGADLELTRGQQRSVVGFKRWKAASVGVEALRELHAAQLRLDADASLYVAAGAVSDKASDFARDAPVQLVGPAELAQLLRTSAAPRRP